MIQTTKVLNASVLAKPAHATLIIYFMGSRKIFIKLNIGYHMRAEAISVLMLEGRYHKCCE